MKIGINAMSLQRRMSGVGRYASSLIQVLSVRSLDMELYSYDKISALDNSFILKSSDLNIRNNLTMKFLWDQIFINRLISHDTNIFHSPSFILPFKKVKNVKYIDTVHDFAFLRYPNLYDWKTRLYLNIFHKRSLQNADALICVSYSCQKDLELYYPAYLHKSIVIHNGFTDFSNVLADDSILRRHNIHTTKYLLTVGFHPRKNVKLTVEIFNELNKKFRDIKLVLAGYNEDIKNNGFDKIIDNNNIVFTGPVTESELASLYKNSYLFIFLSSYEGFGLPILEAMSCGVPVITCNNSSLPEVSGYDTSLLADNNSSTDAYKIIEEILTNQDLYMRLKEHGYKQIKNFSWEKMGDETITAYKRLLNMENDL